MYIKFEEYRVIILELDRRSKEQNFRRIIAKQQIDGRKKLIKRAQLKKIRRISSFKWLGFKWRNRKEDQRARNESVVYRWG